MIKAGVRLLSSAKSTGIDDNLEPGDYPVQVTADGVPSNTGVISVRAEGVRAIRRNESDPHRHPKDYHKREEGRIAMFAEWEDFGIRCGPFGFAFGGAGRVHYASTPTKHVLRIRIGAEAKKQDIKVRLVKPGWLEIEWPRSQGEEIPVE